MQKRKGITKRTRDNIFIALMLLLPVVQFLVFYVYVNIDSILMAFQTPLSGGKTVWGFANFQQLFKEFVIPDSVILNALVNTMIFFFVNLCVIIPLSFLLCYFLYKKIAGYKFFRVVCFLPNIVSASVLVVLYKYIIDVNGPLSVLYQSAGSEIPVFLQTTKYALPAILVYTVFFGLGGNLILFSGAMSNIDSSIIDAAKIDGVGLWKEMWHIVIPMIWPTISTVLVFTFIGVFNASGPILLFTKGAYNTYTIAYWIYDRVTFSGDLYYPAAVGLFFTVIGAPFAIFMRWLLTRHTDDIVM